MNSGLCRVSHILECCKYKVYSSVMHKNFHRYILFKIHTIQSCIIYLQLKLAGKIKFDLCSLGKPWVTKTNHWTLILTRPTFFMYLPDRGGTLEIPLFFRSGATKGIKTKLSKKVMQNGSIECFFQLFFVSWLVSYKLKTS